MNKQEREIRTYCREVRAEPREDGLVHITGYAAVFNSWSEDLGGYRERILPGAFTRAIAEDDVRCLLNHDPNCIIGRNRAGTLTLKEDEKGLWFDAVAPDANWARDLEASMRREDINQCSFQFSARPDGEIWKRTQAGDERTLTDVTLFDVSVVTFPAYEATGASVRSAEDVLRAHRIKTESRKDVIRRKIKLMEEKYK